jgi:hypothetical protein
MDIMHSLGTGRALNVALTSSQSAINNFHLMEIKEYNDNRDLQLKLQKEKEAKEFKERQIKEQKIFKGSMRVVAPDPVEFKYNTPVTVPTGIKAKPYSFNSMTTNDSSVFCKCI